LRERERERERERLTRPVWPAADAGGRNASWHRAWADTGFGLNWDKPPLAEGCRRHRWEPTVACPKLGDGKHTAALIQYFRRASAIDQVGGVTRGARRAREV
jgi:hypothetical protein